MNALVQDNMRGLIISQRPDEVMASKMNRTQPFNSTFPLINPIGYNPNLKFKVITNKAPDMRMHNRNRKIIQNIQRLKSLEKEIVQDEEINNKRKVQKVRLNALKQNKMINEIRDEVRRELNRNEEEGNGNLQPPHPQSNSLNELPRINHNKPKDEDIIQQFFNEEAKENITSNIPKIDPSKKPKWCLTKEEAEQLNDIEDEKLIDFAQNFDYDKYLKDVEVKEALYLIKNKIESGNADHEFKVKRKEGEEEAIEENKEINEEKVRNTEEAEKLRRELTVNKAEHENDWNSSNKVGETEGNKLEEKYKKSIAEELLKNNSSLKAVHSINSIKKLLDREGGLASIANLKENGNLILSHKPPLISILEEKPGTTKLPRDASQLPFLHEYPVI